MTTSSMANALLVLALAIGTVGDRALAGDDCEPSWLQTFGSTGLSGVQVLASFDDGSGPLLYQGGQSELPTHHLATWNGSFWSVLGSNDIGVSGEVHTMLVHDDALYVAGGFSLAAGAPVGRIARWDGSAWSSLGSGVNDDIWALAAFDDGSGPALYAGGEFGSAGGDVDADHLARWDGSTWSSVGNAIGPNVGPNSHVYALAVYDDGSGPALYVGGVFQDVDGIGADRIARWDGSSWSAVGTGIDGGTSPSVNALAVYDDGSGPALYVGGRFTNAGGVSASNIARWDGLTWSAVGTGVADATLSPIVRALAVHDDGGGEALYAGGFITTAGGLAVNNIARWDGSSWSALGSGVNGVVTALTRHDDGSGPALYAGGGFTTAGGSIAQRTARWDGSSWSTLGSEMNNDVLATMVHDDGGGPALYIAGDFTIAGDIFANRIARWDGSSWSALGTGLNSSVYVMEAYDDGSGPAIYVGGSFSSAGGVPANDIARWDGSSWSALGSGTNSIGVKDLEVYDDGSGPALYAGGHFSTAGGVTVNHVARWNGTAWSAVGGGTNDDVEALLVHDGDLYAGGWFTTAGGVPANRVARWDGSSWSALGGGMNNVVLSLTLFDDGSGPALHAGGGFTNAGAVPANRVARWDGSQWSALGSGISGGVWALEAYNDGSGPALFAGGGFLTADGMPATDIARWDGSSWSSIESGMSGSLTLVEDMAVYDDGSGTGPALFVGGNFLNSATGDSYLAKFGCAETNPYDFTGDGVVGFADLVEVLLNWGACPDPCAEATCPWDVDESCNVGFGDLTLVLVNWG